MQNPQDVQLAAAALRKRAPASFFSGSMPPIGIILGTGLSAALDATGSILVEIPFPDIDGFPTSGVQSHAGRFICGLWQNTPALIQQGRCHLYEGKSAAEVCMGVRVMGALGIKTLIITNAAGCLNPLFDSPGLMLLRDIINYTGASPLTGPNCDAWGERFPDMSEPFDGELRRLAAKTALDLRIPLFEGVYIGVHGPEMETPAETRMYRQWGADAVGMSTALEVIAARHLNIKCLGLSCLTNKNMPDNMAPTPLESVIRAAETLSPVLCRLVSTLLEKLGNA